MYNIPENQEIYFEEICIRIPKYERKKEAILCKIHKIKFPIG